MLYNPQGVQLFSCQCSKQRTQCWHQFQMVPQYSCWCFYFSLLNYHSNSSRRLCQDLNSALNSSKRRTSLLLHEENWDYRIRITSKAPQYPFSPPSYQCHNMRCLSYQGQPLQPQSFGVHTLEGVLATSLCVAASHLLVTLTHSFIFISWLLSSFPSLLLSSFGWLQYPSRWAT